jgi:DNA primase
MTQTRQKGAPLLVELLELTRDHSMLTPGALVERFRDRPEGRHLAELLVTPVLVSETAAPQVLADSLQRIMELDREERLADLVSKAEAGALTAEEKEEFRRLQRGPASDMG